MKPIGPQTLTTLRLVLRAPQMTDAEALVRIRSLPMSLAEAQKTVTSIIKKLHKPFTFH